MFEVVAFFFGLALFWAMIWAITDLLPVPPVGVRVIYAGAVIFSLLVIGQHFHLLG